MNATDQLGLSVRGVSKAFGGREVLTGVSLQVKPGEAVALVGPSGSGKSTLLNIIGSLESPDEGSVELMGQGVTKLDKAAKEAYRNQSVGFLFQEHHLLPQLSALENVLLPTLGVRGISRSSNAQELLNAFGLNSRAKDFPATLSGGERQRAALARALIMDPLVLLCDEPTGSLDQSSGDELISRLLELAHRQKKILLVVTHNPAQAARFDRTLKLVDGKLR